MTEVNAFGDEQSFDLMELKQMPRVDRVAPVAFARERRPQSAADDACMVRICIGDVCGRSSSVSVSEKRIEAFARRMIGRNVQGVEIVVVGFDLGADDDGESVASKIRARVFDDAP